MNGKILKLLAEMVSSVSGVQTKNDICFAGTHTNYLSPEMC